MFLQSTPRKSRIIKAAKEADEEPTKSHISNPILFSIIVILLKLRISSLFFDPLMNSILALFILLTLSMGF